MLMLYNYKHILLCNVIDEHLLFLFESSFTFIWMFKI